MNTARTLAASPSPPPTSTTPGPPRPPVWAPLHPVGKYRALTAYRAPELFARGERAWLEKFYGWGRSLGATTLRVYGMWATTGYSPHTFPKYYDQLHDFFEHAISAGFWVHYGALRDQEPHSVVLLPLRMERTRHIERTVALARLADRVLYELGDVSHAELYPSLAGFQAQPPARVPSLTWEPPAIGGRTSPGEHAVNAAVHDEAGEGWCIHGGFSSVDPRDASDLQNCIVPGPGAALDCARAVGDVWNAR